MKHSYYPHTIRIIILEDFFHICLCRQVTISYIVYVNIINIHSLMFHVLNATRNVNHVIKIIKTDKKYIKRK